MHSVCYSSLIDLAWGLRRSLSAVVSMQARGSHRSGVPGGVFASRETIMRFPFLAPHSWSTDLRQRLQEWGTSGYQNFLRRSAVPMNRSVAHGVEQANDGCTGPGEE